MQRVSHRQASGNHPPTIPRPWGISGERDKRELCYQFVNVGSDIHLSGRIVFEEDFAGKYLGFQVIADKITRTD